MSSLRHVKRCLTNVKSQAQLNAFISFADHAYLEQCAQDVDDRQETAGALHGKLIAIKDNICTSDLPTTAGSLILQNFTSPFDATVVRKLHDHGALIAGKTNLDEFGMGSHSTFSHFGPVKNPHPSNDNNNNTQNAFSAGGSSGGSAVAVATSQCWAALGTDTGGSVRLPAAYTGIVGFKPSYGLLSRWGVIAYANSLDTVGVLAPTTSIARTVFHALNAHDDHDPTSLAPSVRRRIAAAFPRQHRAPLRIGVPTHYNIAELAPAVRAAWHATLARLRALGHTLHPVALPSTPAALAAYYVLAPAEASSNLAKYDGVRYGYRAAGPDGGRKLDDGKDGGGREVLYARTRGEGFGAEVKRRIVLGAYTLSKGAMGNYFVQAQRVRRRVVQEFDAVFRAENVLRENDKQEKEEEGVDVLCCPTAPGLPPKLEEVERQSPIEAYTNDVFTVPASLAGLPAVSVPVPSVGGGGGDGEEGFPFVGMQIIGQFGSDEVVLDVAQALEEQIAEKKR